LRRDPAVTSEPTVGLTRGRVLALRMQYTRRVRFRYELEQEDDGRWLVEIMELPGCMAYGSSAEDALRAAQVLAFRILADRLEHHEQAAVPDISFVQAA
jgi:predicted RNase H-like HicB family nuclease